MSFSRFSVLAVFLMMVMSAFVVIPTYNVGADEDEGGPYLNAFPTGSGGDIEDYEMSLHESEGGANITVEATELLENMDYMIHWEIRSYDPSTPEDTNVDIWGEKSFTSPPTSFNFSIGPDILNDADLNPGCYMFYGVLEEESDNEAIIIEEEDWPFTLDRSMSECGQDENGGPWIDVFPFEHDYHISEDEKEESYLVDAHFGYMNPDWTFTYYWAILDHTTGEQLYIVSDFIEATTDANGKHSDSILVTPSYWSEDNEWKDGCYKFVLDASGGLHDSFLFTVGEVFDCESDNEEINEEDCVSKGGTWHENEQGEDGEIYDDHCHLPDGQSQDMWYCADCDCEDRTDSEGTGEAPVGYRQCFGSGDEDDDREDDMSNLKLEINMIDLENWEVYLTGDYSNELSEAIRQHYASECDRLGFTADSSEVNKECFDYVNYLFDSDSDCSFPDLDTCKKLDECADLDMDWNIECIRVHYDACSEYSNADDGLCKMDESIVDDYDVFYKLFDYQGGKIDSKAFMDFMVKEMEDENDEDDYYSQGLYSVNEFTIDAAGDYKILSDYHFFPGNVYLFKGAFDSESTDNLIAGSSYTCFWADTESNEVECDNIVEVSLEAADYSLVTVAECYYAWNDDDGDGNYDRSEFPSCHYTGFYNHTIHKTDTSFDETPRLGGQIIKPLPSKFMASYNDSETVHENCHVDGYLPVKFGIGSNDGSMDDPEYQIEAQITGLTGENPLIFNAGNVVEFNDLATRLTDDVIEDVMFAIGDCSGGGFREDFDGNDYTDEWRNSVYSPLNNKTVTEIRLHVTDKEAYSDTKDTYKFRWEFYVACDNCFEEGDLLFMNDDYHDLRSSDRSNFYLYDTHTIEVGPDPFEGMILSFHENCNDDNDDGLLEDGECYGSTGNTYLYDGVFDPANPESNLIFANDYHSPRSFWGENYDDCCYTMLDVQLNPGDYIVVTGASNYWGQVQDYSYVMSSYDESVADIEWEGTLSATDDDRIYMPGTWVVDDLDAWDEDAFMKTEDELESLISDYKNGTLSAEASAPQVSSKIEILIDFLSEIEFDSPSEDGNCGFNSDSEYDCYSLRTYCDSEYGDPNVLTYDPKRCANDIARNCEDRDSPGCETFLEACEEGDVDKEICDAYHERVREDSVLLDGIPGFESNDFDTSEGVVGKLTDNDGVVHFKSFMELTFDGVDETLAKHTLFLPGDSDDEKRPIVNGGENPDCRQNWIDNGQPVWSQGWPHYGSNITVEWPANSGDLWYPEGGAITENQEPGLGHWWPCKDNAVSTSELIVNNGEHPDCHLNWIDNGQPVWSQGWAHYGSNITVEWPANSGDLWYPEGGAIAVNEEPGLGHWWACGDNEPEEPVTIVINLAEGYTIDSCEGCGDDAKYGEGMVEFTADFDGGTDDIVITFSKIPEPEPQNDCDHKIGLGPDGYTFDPISIKIDIGETVCWSWTNAADAHNVWQVASKSEGTDWANATFEDGFYSGAPNKTVDFRVTFSASDFDDDTTYFYMCEPHADMGMVGEIVVGNGTPQIEDAIQELEESGLPNVGFLVGVLVLVGAAGLRRRIH